MAIKPPHQLQPGQLTVRRQACPWPCPHATRHACATDAVRPEHTPYRWVAAEQLHSDERHADVALHLETQVLHRQGQGIGGALHVHKCGV